MARKQLSTLSNAPMTGQFPFSFPFLAAVVGVSLHLGSWSPALASELPLGFVRLADVAPQVAQDMRYAGPRNFTGAPAPGYEAPQCWLRAEAAKALAQAQADARGHGFDLVVYDCYRPRRAVAAFVVWSQNPDHDALIPKSASVTEAEA